MSAAVTSDAGFGDIASRIAERWLSVHGWRLLQRRFDAGGRAIDLIAERRGVVAFVAVRAWRGDGYAGPPLGLAPAEQHALGRTAAVWIARHGRPGDAFRIDLIGVLLAPDGVLVGHVEGAVPLASAS